MRSLSLLALAVLFFSCNISNPQPSNTFTLKFINVGKFAVTGFYLNPGNDSINWGQNVLPVATLDSLQYVFIGNLSKASGYVMRARFDSLGSAAYLIFHIVTSPDTISAYAALGPSGAYSIGYEWGLRIWAGEQRVGQ